MSAPENFANIAQPTVLTQRDEAVSAVVGWVFEPMRDDYERARRLLKIMRHMPSLDVLALAQEITSIRGGGAL